ncbi:hypothetical protein N665_0366s0009 [Sinapis alba]|nr:hypothetical protein N665_0366s0009 [Sinapis alba]
METGEASQPQKVKGVYFPWTSQESQLLKRLLVDGIRRGWRDSNGSLTKRTIETKVLPILNKQLGCNKTHKHYLNRMKSLKKEYQSYSDLLRFSSGFGWDPITKSRFAIFKSASPFSYKKQAGLVLACTGLYNFLRKECRSDVGEFPVEANVQENATNANQVIGEEPLGTQEQDRENANAWRTAIGEDMWRDVMDLDDQ